jgi:hypothetical protein
MNDSSPASPAAAPRRSFLGQLAGVLVVGVDGLSAKSSAARAQTAPGDGPNWPGTLPGRHKQLVDAYAVNGGHPLAFAYTFLAPNTSATAVVVLRHDALPIALESAIWQKYKIGESFKIIDPETKAPAEKNPFLRAKPGVLAIDDMAVDRLLAKGVVFGACSDALQGQSKALAGNAGVSAEEAAKDWAANLIAGITLVPTGTWGLNRAQEAGCSFCAGGS